MNRGNLMVLIPMCLGGGMAGAQKAPQSEITTLKPEARKALDLALTSLAGEYAGVGVHAAIVTKYGRVQPYFLILQDEINHRSMLQRLYRKYRLPVPENAYRRTAKAPNSLKEAVQIAVEHARLNIALYDKLLPDVQGYSDMKRAFQHLRTMTRTRHLPLLLRAAERGGRLQEKGLPSSPGSSRAHQSHAIQKR